MFPMKAGQFGPEVGRRVTALAMGLRLEGNAVLPQGTHTMRMRQRVIGTWMSQM